VSGYPLGAPYFLRFFLIIILFFGGRGVKGLIFESFGGAWVVLGGFKVEVVDKVKDKSESQNDPHNNS